MVPSTLVETNCRFNKVPGFCAIGDCHNGCKMAFCLKGGIAQMQTNQGRAQTRLTKHE